MFSKRDLHAVKEQEETHWNNRNTLLQWIKILFVWPPILTKCIYAFRGEILWTPTYPNDLSQFHWYWANWQHVPSGVMHWEGLIMLSLPKNAWPEIKHTWTEGHPIKQLASSLKKMSRLSKTKKNWGTISDWRIPKSLDNYY